MADVILFHHVLGKTTGIDAFADELRSAGHRVTVPDLFAGRIFPTIEEGLAFADQVGFEQIIARGVAAAEQVSGRAVYAGFSLGVLPAQKLAQSRAGAAGAILYFSAVAPAELGSVWPEDVPLQMHAVA